MSVSEGTQVQPKPRTIDFTVKDSSDNIIFMDNTSNTIKAATFSKLIERLCAASDYLGEIPFHVFLVLLLLLLLSLFHFFLFFLLIYYQTQMIFCSLIVYLHKPQRF
jgi:hypothetical protein